MDYTKDERTKNLTLRDIHVGDWVQVWSNITERYSPPLKIIQICDDGTIYLVTSDEERSTPWEENIKDVDALPITPELLKGFGFEIVKNEFHKDRYHTSYKGCYICELRKYSCGYGLSIPWHCFEYFHEFIDSMCDDFLKILNFEWKGLE